MHTDAQSGRCRPLPPSPQVSPTAVTVTLLTCRRHTAHRSLTDRRRLTEDHSLSLTHCHALTITQCTLFVVLAVLWFVKF